MRSHELDFFIPLTPEAAAAQGKGADECMDKGKASPCLGPLIFHYADGPDDSWPIFRCAKHVYEYGFHCNCGEESNPD